MAWARLRHACRMSPGILPGQRYAGCRWEKETSTERNMRWQRHLLRVFWQPHISNRSIRERTKQPTALSLLRKHRLRWFGHLHRMSSSIPVRRVYRFEPNIHGWKRSRGRPETRWADSIKHDLNSAGLVCPDGLWFTPVEGHLLADCQHWNPSKAL